MIIGTTFIVQLIRLPSIMAGDSVRKVFFLYRAFSKSISMKTFLISILYSFLHGVSNILDAL